MSVRGLVTVVIPVYNGEAFVLDAIKSVREQTYTNIECIVVDDGSTDRTAEIVAEIDEIRFLSKDNGGVSSARNYGARQASGDFVAFLDADDVWLPSKLERQMALFAARPELAMVYCGLLVVDEDLSPQFQMEAAPGDAALRNSLLLEPPVMSVAQTAVVRSEILRAVGGFDERLSTSADTDFGCRVAARYSVERVPEPLVLYRQHGAQMHLSPEVMERDMLIVLGKMFSDGGARETVRGFRRRAYSNLFSTLSLAYARQGKVWRSLGYALKALWRSPARALPFFLGRLFGRR